MTSDFDTLDSDKSQPPLMCWRCGLEAGDDLRCTHCGAMQKTNLINQINKGIIKPKHPNNMFSESSKLFAVIIGFVLLLFVSIIHGIISITEGRNQPAEFHNKLMIVIEGIDTAIVFAVWAYCKKTPLPFRKSYHRLTWLLALPILGILILINTVYHHLLIEFIKIGKDKLAAPPEFSVFTICAVCIQPAIVEELFFRYLLIGVFRKYCGVHASVFISSIMFAICHMYAFLSTPYLFLVGIVFGYSRIYSRSIILPIILHFLHNLIVTYLESAR
jgi:uncharacterized protein